MSNLFLVNQILSSAFVLNRHGGTDICILVLCVSPEIDYEVTTTT